MPRIKPYSGTSLVRLSKLIRDNQTPTLPNAVGFHFGLPEEGELPIPGATAVQAEAFTTERTDAPVVIQYKRLELDVVKNLPVGEVIPFQDMIFPISTHDILPLINEALGVNLTVDEVDNDTTASIPEDGLVITINNKSLAWLPGEYLFSFAPGATNTVGRGVDGKFPTDERMRLRIREDEVI